MKQLSSKEQAFVEAIVEKVILNLEKKQLCSCKNGSSDLAQTPTKININRIQHAIKKNILVIIGSFMLVFAWWIQTILLPKVKDRIELYTESSRELNEALGRICLFDLQERNDLLFYNFSTSVLFGGYKDEEIEDYAYSTRARMYRTAVEWFAAEKYWLKNTFGEDSVMVANLRYDKKLSGLIYTVDSLKIIDDTITRKDTVSAPI